MYKYPKWTMSKTSTRRALAFDPSKGRELVGILQNMVVGAEDPKTNANHRQWCAGQASVISAYLNVIFPNPKMPA